MNRGEKLDETDVMMCEISVLINKRYNELFYTQKIGFYQDSI
jgi:hypothetical protein